MDNYTATEVAYKNGYKQGFADATKWIPVTERLPEDRASVLGFENTCFGRYARIVRFANHLEEVDELDFKGCKHDGFYTYDSEYGYYEVTDITHWQPLPQPPKEE